MKIVPISEIPHEIVKIEGNLMQVYATCLQLQQLCVQEDGVGISAFQVGLPWNLFLVRYPQNRFEYFVDCKYEPASEKQNLNLEGCLSLKTSKGKLRYFEINRWQAVFITGFKLTERNQEPILEPVEKLLVEDFYAAVFQHEIDHSFGRERMLDVIGRELELQPT